MPVALAVVLLVLGVGSHATIIACDVDSQDLCTEIVTRVHSALPDPLRDMRDSYCPLITSAYLGTPTVVYANDSEARYTVTRSVVGGPVNIEARIIEAMIN